MNETTQEPYAPNTPLPRTFGETPETLILSTLTSERHHSLPIQEIKRLSGTKINETHETLRHLEEKNIITRGENQDGRKTYKLNPENDAAKLLVQMEWNLAIQQAEKAEEAMENHD